MPDISLNYILTGTDKSASKTMEQTATVGQRAGQAIGRSFSGLGTQIGGEVGAILTRVGTGIDQLATRGLSASAKLGVLGTGITGLGVALMAFGSASKAADDQLKAAFDAAGYAVVDYQEKIDELIQSNYRLGHDDDATKNALRTMTIALGDPTKALEKMSLVADYAAARNISLTESADALSKSLSGGSTRAFTAMGIVVEQNADGTKNLEKASDQLAAKLDGQASAAANNFSGGLRSVWVAATDMAEDFATNVGPAITVVGGIMTGVSAVLQIVTAVQNARAAATARATAAEVMSVGATSAASEALSAETIALIQNTGAKNTSSVASARGATGMMEYAGKAVLVATALAGAAAVHIAMFDAQGKLVNLITGAGAVSLDKWGKQLREGSVDTKLLADHTLAAGDGFRQWWNSTVLVDQGTKDLYESTSNLDQAMAALPADLLKERYEDLAAAAAENGQSQEDLARILPAAAAAYQGVTDATRDATQASSDAVPTTERAADAYLKAEQNASSLESTLGRLVDTINESNGVGQDAVSANIEYQDAIRGVGEVLQKHIDDYLKPQRDAYLEANGTLDGFVGDLGGFAHTLDVATQAGSENYQALLNVASAGQDAAAATLAVDGNTQAYVASLQANRDKVLQNATDLGATDEQIKFISEHIVAMPTQKEIDILVETTAARQRLDSLLSDYDNRVISVQTLIRQIDRQATGGTIGRAGGGSIAHMSTAGTVVGGGTPTSDTATRRPVMLSIGEEVTKAYSASYPGVRPLLKSLNRDPGGTMQQLAGGSPSSAPTQVLVADRSSARQAGPVTLDPASMREMARIFAREARAAFRDGGSVDH